MQPVSGGWVSHKIKGDGDYEAKKRAALAQSQSNSYTQGVQSVMEDGAGQAIANTRTKSGNVNLMPQGAGTPPATLQSKHLAISLSDLANQTGAVSTQVSSTNVPQEDPAEMESDAVSRRIDLARKGIQAFQGYNDPNRGFEMNAKRMPRCWTPTGSRSPRTWWRFRGRRTTTR